jgi:hypothetical protein
VVHFCGFRGVGYPALSPSATCQQPLDVSNDFTFKVIDGILSGNTHTTKRNHIVTSTTPCISHLFERSNSNIPVSQKGRKLAQYTKIGNSNKRW